MIGKICVLPFLLLGFSRTASTHREHKVHNIVLYPERYSWCLATPIKQIVTMSGFEPMTIDNNVCVGACYSYSIPKTDPAEPGELIGPYCDSCQPLETKCYHVTLKADSGNPNKNSTIQKRVQIITTCSCSTCTNPQKNECETPDLATNELPNDLFDHNKTDLKNERYDIPELLNITHLLGANHLPTPLPENATEEQRLESNSQLIGLLKSIQSQEDDEESNFVYDKDTLSYVLEVLEDSQELFRDRNLMNYVSFVSVHNSENIELDLNKLKEVLSAEGVLKKKHYGLEALEINNNDDINRDLKKYNVPNNFGIEGSHSDLGSLKGSHIAMGHHNNLESNLVDGGDNIDKNKIIKLHESKGHQKLTLLGSGHHHSGEIQHVGAESGHLIPGPHGSLVLVPDSKIAQEAAGPSTMVYDLRARPSHNNNDDVGLRVGEIDTTDLRPNQEGLFVSYDNHRSHRHDE